MDTPLLLIAFNRPKHTKLVFERIREIRPKNLYVAFDGPRPDFPEEAVKCSEVKKLVLEGIDWNCHVNTLIREENLGCGIAVSSAIDWFFSHVEQGIILEDDIVPDPSFFCFCEHLLEQYQHDARIMMISGFNFLGYSSNNEASYAFYRLASCWGWATWRRAWKFNDYKITEWENIRNKRVIQKVFRNSNHASYLEYQLNRLSKMTKKDTWDYQWVLAIIAQSGLAIVPNANLIENIGFGPEATHTSHKSLNIPTKPIAFPMVHPEVITIDEEAQSRTLEKIINIGYLPGKPRAKCTPDTIGYNMFVNRNAWPWVNTNNENKFDNGITWPKISIVTPTLNQGQFIEETIRSVIFQNYPNLQYIIIDGGSTDNTVDVIKKYDKYIDYWVSEKDLGQSDAINKGLSKCNGDIFNWINSDDSYEENAFRTIAGYFMEEDIDLLVAREFRFYNKSYKTLASGSVLTNDFEQTILTGQIDQPSTFWRRETITSLGNLDVDMHYAMDADMWMRYLLANGPKKIKKTGDAIVNFRLHSASKTVNCMNKMVNEKHRLAHSLAAALDLPAAYLHISESFIEKLIIKEYCINVEIDRSRFKNMYKKYLLHKCISKKDFSKAIKADELT